MSHPWHVQQHIYIILYSNKWRIWCVSSFGLSYARDWFKYKRLHHDLYVVFWYIWIIEQCRPENDAKNWLNHIVLIHRRRHSLRVMSMSFCQKKSIGEVIFKSLLSMWRRWCENRHLERSIIARSYAKDRVRDGQTIWNLFTKLIGREHLEGKKTVTNRLGEANFQGCHSPVRAS